MTAPAAQRPGCLPGCRRHDVDRDGTAYCTALVAEPAVTTDPAPRTVVVDVDQQRDPDGSIRRVVVLAMYDDRGRLDGDPITLDPAVVPGLVAALGTAEQVAR